MTIQQEALNAYLKFLNSKGVSLENLNQRKRFLEQFILQLADKPYTRLAYADALNLMMKKAGAEWHAHLHVAREFYPFWQQDLKAIALLNAHYGFEIQSIQWKPLPTTLELLSKKLASEKFSETESVRLERYLLFLHEKGIEKSQCLVRIKLAKIMLLRLRDAPVTNNFVYRKAVDVTLPLFRLRKSRQLFLEVVREFYAVCLENPAQ